LTEQDTVFAATTKKANAINAAKILI